MASIIGTPDYKLAKIILSKASAFTLDEFERDVKNEGLSCDFDELKKVLKRFRENGILVEHGSKYSLISTIFG